MRRAARPPCLVLHPRFCSGQTDGIGGGGGGEGDCKKPETFSFFFLFHSAVHTLLPSPPFPLFLFFQFFYSYGGGERRFFYRRPAALPYSLLFLLVKKEERAVGILSLSLSERSKGPREREKELSKGQWTDGRSYIMYFSTSFHTPCSTDRCLVINKMSKFEMHIFNTREEVLMERECHSSVFFYPGLSLSQLPPFSPLFLPLRILVKLNSTFRLRP